MPDAPDQPAREPEPGGYPPAAVPEAEPGPAPASAPSGDAPPGDAPDFTFDPAAATTPPAPAPDGTIGRSLALAAGNGTRYVAEHVLDPAGRSDVRYAVSVIETKVPYAERPTRGLLDTDAEAADRQYAAVWQPLNDDDQLGAPDAPDDDPRHGVGVQAWWRGYFTESEVGQLRAAPNMVAVTYETVFEPR